MFAFNAHDGDYAAVVRLTRLAWYECDGASLLHVGGSVMQQTTVDDQLTFRTRDAIRTGLSRRLAGAGHRRASSPATTCNCINGELAAVYGPWTFQGEYLVSFMQNAAAIVGNVVQPSVGTVNYHGGYVQVLYFLTGEHDNYNKRPARSSASFRTRTSIFAAAAWRADPARGRSAPATTIST